MAGAAGRLVAVATRPVVRAWPVVRWLWRGLAGVAGGGDPAPVWRSPWQRRAVYGGLAGATVLLSGVSLASVSRLGGPAGLFTFNTSLPTPQGRKDAFARMQKYALEQVYTLPLGSLTKVQAVRSNVKGYVPYRIPLMSNVWFEN